MRIVQVLLIFVTIFCVHPLSIAASGKKSAPASDSVSSTSAPNEQLSERVDDIEYKLFGLEYRINELESGSATVSTEEEKYGIARTKYGPFLVFSRGVTPFLDGYKVKLAIGNLTTATFTGAKVQIKWGLPFPVNGKREDFTKYLKSKKEKEFDVTDHFRSGAYTQIELSISPSTPEEIKRIEVGLTLNTVSFR